MKRVNIGLEAHEGGQVHGQLMLGDAVERMQALSQTHAGQIKLDLSRSAVSYGRQILYARARGRGRMDSGQGHAGAGDAFQITHDPRGVSGP